MGAKMHYFGSVNSTIPHRTILAHFAAAALLILAWRLPLAVLIFPAFVFLWHIIMRGGPYLFWRLYFIFALWNAGTTYWISNAHPIGVVATVGINGALMAGALWFGARAGAMQQRFPFFQRRTWLRHVPVMAAWMAFEQLHENWGLSFPWLNLGNTFHSQTEMVQFYEWTGAVGGTLWVLLYAAVDFESRQKGKWLGPVLTFVLPLSISLGLYFYPGGTREVGEISVAVVQPNIDAYVEKWEMPEKKQIHKVESLLESELKEDGVVDLIVLPETFLPKARETGKFGSKSADVELTEVLRKFGKTALFGATTYSIEHTPTLYNRPIGDQYYTPYNVALFLNSRTAFPTEYRKGKLVVGGETMPFVRLLKPLLGDWAVELGGTSGTLGISDERTVFEDQALGLRLAPIICWENEFSDYSTAYARQGANLLAVITNDGWWGNTDGHVQHMKFSALRAIEQRKYLVRSANTGISTIIDDRGRVGNTLGWEQDGVLVDTVPLLAGETLYVKTGNVLGPVFTGVFFLYAGLVLFSRFFRLRPRRRGQ